MLEVGFLEDVTTFSIDYFYFIGTPRRIMFNALREKESILK
jgi:hypothetical protein